MNQGSSTWQSGMSLNIPAHSRLLTTVLHRFFERIAKTYRKEKWDAMLIPLLTTWYRCAQQLGDMELSVQLLLEMLAHGEGVRN